MIDMHALNWDKCVAVREQIKLHENKNQIGGIKLVHKRLKVQFIKKNIYDCSVKYIDNMINHWIVNIIITSFYNIII